MSIVRINDIWLKNGAAAEKIRLYLIENKAVCGGALTYTVGLSGECSIELAFELDDDHPKSDSVADDIHEMLIQARLDFVNNVILKTLAWGFSSPAKTAILREGLKNKLHKPLDIPI
jgi:hypothetical protein